LIQHYIKMTEEWRPQPTKTYHPLCEALFTRSINRTLIEDIVKALEKARNAYDLDTFMDDKDIHLRQELLECLAFVTMDYFRQ